MLLRPSILLTAVAGLVAADFATISGALDNVNALLLQINSQILNLDANNIASAGPQLVQLGQTIQPSLNAIAQQIASTAPLTAQETSNLNAARTALDSNVNLTVNDLLAQKPLFDSVNLSPTVADILQQVRTSSDGFFTAITSKLAPVDSNVQVGNLFTQALNVFDMAIAVFRGQAVMATPPSVPAASAGPAAPAAPGAPAVTGQGTGMRAADGSCNCAAVCPAGSFV